MLIRLMTRTQESVAGGWCNCCIINKNNPKKQTFKQRYQTQMQQQANFDITFVNVQDQSEWIIDQPQFKFCKKRKEFFSNQYEEVWYKAPYKYNMRVRVTCKTPCFQDNLSCALSVSFDDGTAISSNPTDILSFVPPKRRKQNAAPRSIDNSDEERAPNVSVMAHELKLGPFQFNICSYKCSGRKFRITVHLYYKSQEFCYLTSPPMLIKAKKPIARPGMKAKRAVDQLENSKPSKRSRMEPEASQVVVEQIQTSPVGPSVQPITHPMPHETTANPSGQLEDIAAQLDQFSYLLNSVFNMIPATMQGPPQIQQQQQQQVVPTHGYNMTQLMSALQALPANNVTGTKIFEKEQPVENANPAVSLLPPVDHQFGIDEFSFDLESPDHLFSI